MIRNRSLVVVIAWAAAVVCCAAAEAQVIERISLDSGGNQVSGPSWVTASTRVVSADGRFVAFSSDATDLVADDGNGLSDVFLRDRVLSTTTRISVDWEDGGDPDAESYTPSISADGRYIAFASLASDLVDSDTNGLLDVYVYDRVSEQVIRASRADSAGETDGDSKDPFIDGSGRYVVFNSTATNLTAGGANTNQDIYLYDLVLDQITKISDRPGTTMSEGNSRVPAISADGRHVVFSSRDTGLVPGDTNETQDVFVRDLDTWDIERVSVTTAGEESNGWNGVPVISSDGSVVAWWSNATNLVDGDDNGQPDIFVHDRSSGTTVRVNLSSAGEQAVGGGSWHATITDNGRFVVFLSDAGNLADGDVNGTGDVFSHDRLTGITRLHSLTPEGVGGNDYSRCPSVSPDGTYIAFESGASDLVSDDDNSQQDVFLAWGPAVVVVDGFESGDCAGWSADIGACDPDGVYSVAPTVAYACAFGAVDVFVTHLEFSDHGRVVAAGSGLPVTLTGAPSYCGDGSFSNSGSVVGGCTEVYTVDGTFTGPDSWSGTLSMRFSGSSCSDCTDQTIQITGDRE